jgi:hypothetical protein
VISGNASQSNQTGAVAQRNGLKEDEETAQRKPGAEAAQRQEDEEEKVLRKPFR